MTKVLDSAKRHSGVMLLILTVIFQSCIKQDADDCNDTLTEVSFRFLYDYNHEYIDRFDDHVYDLSLFFDSDNWDVYNTVELTRNDLLTGNIHREMLYPGTYTLTVWGNLDTDHYSLVEDDSRAVVLSKCDGNNVVEGDLTMLFHSQITFMVLANSNVIHDVSLVRDTNNISVALDYSNVPAGKYSLGDFEISMSGCNGEYYFDNSYAGWSQLLYMPNYSITPTHISADFNVMRLTPDSDMMISIVNQETGGQYSAYSESLVKLILDNLEAQKPELLKMNIYEFFDRYHDFSILFELDEDEEGLRIRPVIEITDWNPVVPPGANV